MGGWWVRGGTYMLCEGLVPCFDRAEEDGDEGRVGPASSSSVVAGTDDLMDFGFALRLG